MSIEGLVLAFGCCSEEATKGGPGDATACSRAATEAERQGSITRGQAVSRQGSLGNDDGASPAGDG